MFLYVAWVRVCVLIIVRSACAKSSIYMCSNQNLKLFDCVWVFFFGLKHSLTNAFSVVSHEPLQLGKNIPYVFKRFDFEPLSSSSSLSIHCRFPNGTNYSKIWLVSLCTYSTYNATYCVNIKACLSRSHLFFNYNTAGYWNLLCVVSLFQSACSFVQFTTSFITVLGALCVLFCTYIYIQYDVSLLYFTKPVSVSRLNDVISFQHTKTYVHTRKLTRLDLIRFYRDLILSAAEDLSARFIVHLVVRCAVISMVCQRSNVVHWYVVDL